MSTVDEFVIPSFLENQGVDEIHDRMMDALPDDIDKSECGYPWDFTRPTAIEHSQLLTLFMVEAIKLIFPQYSSGVYLDYHGGKRVQRKPGIAATGELLVEGEAGGIINKGDLFSTESVNEESSVDYEALDTYTIPESGSVTVKVQCTEVGNIGNAQPDTVILKDTQNDSITSVTNPNAITGGIDEESDDDYRERIMEYDISSDSSYVGNISDYKRWASEVNGVGTVNVIPAKDTTGLVTIVATDGNGAPASSDICNAIYNHIMSPDNPEQRLAPIGALLSVTAPESMSVSISATIELQGETLENVKASLLKSVQAYLSTCSEDKEIRYTKICSIISSISGVYDYGNVTVNGSQINIPVATNVMPSIEEKNILLTSGSIS